ncbi:MAG: T9SS type A sorting domain-containing protein [Lewinellaceae bacterium]|nr:T9SS type A sorting domain-containing protein [Lewinellaceae bacterium]
MKKSLLVLSFLLAGYFGALAQMPNGSVAPNFTVVDINGNSHNLYNLLNQGKTVYLDFFATWCAPCWNYHQTHALRDLWDQYGPPGTGEAFVIGIEGDCNTNTPCISQLPGCNDPNNQGNWADGIPYPLVDNCSIRQQYQVAYYPTIYMICPADKKIYEVGQQGVSGLWAARSSNCPPMIVNTVLNSVQNTVCYGNNTGAIDISVSGGNPPYTYQWSNGATTQDLTNVPAGTYQCTITSAQGWPGETDPITVENPPAPLAAAVVATTPVGCNGVYGSIEVEASGGWDDLYFNWSNGMNGPNAQGLSAGTFTCTVTDSRGCTKTVNTSLAPPTNPAASIAPPGTVTCTTPTIQLSASGMGGYSGDYNFQWTTGNGGNIVSGANTPTPTVNAGGNYTVQVSDVVTTCSGFMVTVVAANLVKPNADAGPGMAVSCAIPSVELEGSGSAGANISYQWSAINGGHIESGGNTLTPVVDAAGNYILVVSNSTNGCTQSDTTGVAGNNVPPTVEVDNDNLTCVVSSVTLEATTNANDPVFAWTGPNGFASNLQNPTTGEAGAYQLAVTDPNTGCTTTTTTTVANDTEPPGATATGGALTCVVLELELLAEAEAPVVTYSWTGPGGFVSNLQEPGVSLPGDYSVVITDSNNGCTSTAVAVVAQNTVPPASAAATPGALNCTVSELELDGSASAQGANINYAWTTADGNIVSGENTTTPTVDAPGAYNLLVTDTDNGCTSTASTTVIQHAPVTASVEDIADVLCHGAATGSATALPAGGNSTYEYAWSNGATTASVTSLAAGTYTVVVTDGEDCTASASVVITEPAVLAPNTSATHQTAANVNDGTATASPTGGAGVYTYLWNTGETTQTITELAPGTYEVIVTDGNACTAVQTVVVNAFDCTLSATTSASNSTCFGANNGTAEVALIGANDPVTFTWSNGANTQEVADLAPGTYTVEVIDNTNCADVLQIVITEPAELEANASATAETFIGANDGTATAIPSGGTGDYTWLWNTGETTQTIENLPPATYTVTVQDENGCTDVQTVIVNAFDCAVSAQPIVANATCSGQNNGTASVALTGGTEPYTYLWSNGETTATIQGLAPGIYTASITDANGCDVVIDGTVTEPAPLEIASEVSQPACADDLGAIETSAGGGTGNYSFAWSNGANTSTVSDLQPGAYSLVLTDDNGCTSTENYTIAVADNEPPQIAAQNTTLELGAAGTTTATLQTLGAAVSDNCTVADVAIVPNIFDCSNLGEQAVTITATDDAGNTSVSTVTVTIADNTPPSVTCPASIIQCWYENTVSYNAPVAQDNCLSNGGGQWNQEEGLPSGSEFPIGETVQTYTYTDGSGNAGSCSFSVTITRPIQLDVPAVTPDVNNQGIGTIDIAVVGGTEPYSFVWTDESGQVIGETEDIGGLSAGIYFVQIKDANGCILANEGITVSNTTSITEPTWLRGVVLRPNPTAGITQIVFAEMPADELEITVSDATGRTVLMQSAIHQTTVRIDCSTLPEGIYTVRFRSGAETGVRKLAVGR